MARLTSLLFAALTLLPLLAACGEDGGGDSPPPGGEDAGLSNNGGSDAAEDASGGEDAASPDAEGADAEGADADAEGGDDAGDAGDLPDADDTPDTSPDAEPDAPMWDCDTFQMAQPRYPTLPLRSLVVSVEGGSGSYRWAFAPDGNRSGGDIDERNGFYIAGQTQGVFDDLEITDTGCNKTITARVEVVIPATLEPDRLILPPQRRLCFNVRNGSGPSVGPESPFVWSLARRGSGQDAQVDVEGCYTSGSGVGVDILQVTDEGTGQVLQAAAEVVSNGVGIQLSAPRVFLPRGESYTVSASGTTGAYTFALANGDTTGSVVEPATSNPSTTFVITAGDRPGTTQVVVRDAFLTDLSTTVEIVVMDTLQHSPVPWGYHSDDMDMQGVGDVNGDGYDDVMIAVRTASVNGTDAGAAWLYLGGPQGLSTTPAQLLSGDRRFNYFGRTLTHGDFNDDGCQDVAIGVFGENLTGSEIGEVRIYTGCNDGEAEPIARDWNGRLNDNLPTPQADSPLRLWRRIGGLNNTDRFGWGVAAGDFNGDGKTDLAVSAARAEASNRINLDSGNPFSNIGRIYTFHQRAGELPELPDWIMDGVVYDASLNPPWTSRNTLTLGGHIVSGRINDDACEDLLVGSWHADSSRGLVSVYLSVPDGAGCRLPAEPAVTIEPASQDGTRAGRLGWRVGLEDVNGDCRPDLLVSHPVSRVLGSGDSSTGNVLIFLNDPAWSHAAPQRLTRDAAAVVFSGDANDQFGFGMSAGDLDGDGISDLVVGNRFGESAATVGDAGELRLYRGLVSNAGCTAAAPDAPLFEEPIVIPNRVLGNQDLFGQMTEIVGDVDGDDVRDLVVFAERGPADEAGDASTDHQGRVYWHPGGAFSWGFDDLIPLDSPLIPTEDRFGYTVEAVGDINDDGYMDFAAGAPWWDQDITVTSSTPVAGTMYPRVDGSAGTALVYLGGPDGVRSTPDAMLAGFAPHNSGDLVGYGLGSAGDIDGDGIGDLAVSAIGQDNDSWCTPCRVGNASRSDTGAVFVYRGRSSLVRHTGAEPTPRLNAPDYVFCGRPTNSTNLGREIAAGVDFNGDGFGDLALSNWNWSSSRGEVMIGLGQAAPATGYATICLDDEDILGTGVNSSDFLGYGLGMMDLNGDGCGDVLASAYNDDQPNRANVGSIHVWLGTGRPGCPATVKHVALYGNTANDNIGFRMALPGDLNGDGVDDVAVGSSGYGPGNLGAVLIYSGAALRQLVNAAAHDDAVTLNSATLLAQLLHPSRESNTQFAAALRAAGDLDGDGVGDLIVGERYSSFNGILRRGAAWIYLGDASSVELETPDAVFSGRALFPDSDFGFAVTGAPVRAGGPGVVLIGAPMVEWEGPEYGEMGEVYLGVFPPSIFNR